MPGSIPPDDLPRSPSGRVPAWVVDRANGHLVDPPGWRTSTTSSEPAAPRRRSRLRRLAVGSALVAAIGVVAAIAVVSGVGERAPTQASAPPPGLEESPTPLGTVPVVPAGDPGSFRFSQTTLAGAPVTFSPCRPIHYVVRTDHAPRWGAALIERAVSEVSAATGLVFVNDGDTDEAVGTRRAAYQPQRYGERWAPVLIGWATPQEVPEFAIDVVGQAGPISVTTGSGESAYVSGEVDLDPDGIAGVRRAQGKAAARAIVLHELGHLVGLDHVADRTQLMFPATSGEITAYQDGDRAGLAALGSGPCQPDL